MQCKFGKDKYEPFMLLVQQGTLRFEVAGGGADLSGMTSTAKIVREAKIYSCKLSNVKPPTAKKPSGSLRVDLNGPDSLGCNRYELKGDDAQACIATFTQYAGLSDKGKPGAFLRMNMAAAEAERDVGSSPLEHMVSLCQDCTKNDTNGIPTESLEELRCALLAFGVFGSTWSSNAGDLSLLTTQLGYTLNATQAPVRLKTLKVLVFLLTPSVDPQQNCDAFIQCCDDLRKDIYECQTWVTTSDPMHGDRPVQVVRETAKKVLALLRADTPCTALPYCTARVHMDHCPCVAR
jgi:hypothetical protein